MSKCICESINEGRRTSLASGGGAAAAVLVCNKYGTHPDLPSLGDLVVREGSSNPSDSRHLSVDRICDKLSQGRLLCVNRKIDGDANDIFTYPVAILYLLIGNPF